jgi:Spy/CpxP family protein refolding chaperone
MKSKLILSLLACGASMALCQSLHAQDASPAPTTTGTSGGHQWGGGRGFDADAILQRLTTALSLTSDQQTQIKPILQTEMTTIQGIRADTRPIPPSTQS